MQTERVTFLTSRDHKAALDAYASKTGQSVGNVVREATSQFISQPRVPKMNASIDEMSQTLQQTHAEVDRMLRAMGARH
jgi:hypothetical protein